MAKGYGDKLARGAAKATYPSTEPGVSQEKFDQAFSDFDPQAYLKNAEAAENASRSTRAERTEEGTYTYEEFLARREANNGTKRSGDSDVEEAGVPSTDSGTVGSN